LLFDYLNHILLYRVDTNVGPEFDCHVPTGAVRFRCENPLCTGRIRSADSRESDGATAEHADRIAHAEARLPNRMETDSEWFHESAFFQ